VLLGGLTAIFAIACGVFPGDGPGSPQAGLCPVGCW